MNFTHSQKQILYDLSNGKISDVNTFIEKHLSGKKNNSETNHYYFDISEREKVQSEITEFFKLISRSLRIT